MSRRRQIQTGIAVFGSALLVAWGVVRLPKRPSYLAVSQTLIDNSGNNDSVPTYRLLTEAERMIPRGATVFVACTTPEPVRETFLHRFAVALLPGRRVLPAAVEGAAVLPSLEPQADYVVLLGRPPVDSHGELLGKINDGTIWKRKPR